MDEKNHNLDEKIDKILMILSPKRSSQLNFLEIADKLLIPIALGILAFITSLAGNKISNAQFELVKAQNTRQEMEARDNLQIKYIELFYKDISSQEQKKQEAALSLLRLIKPEIAKPLLDWATLNVKEELKTETNSIRKQINAQIVRSLSSYEIKLYFLKNIQALSVNAEKIKQTLVGYGLKENQIILVEKDNDFFQRLGYPTNYEVRYDPGREDSAADNLTYILNESDPSKQFVKRPIGSGTEGSISIFFVK